MKNKFIILLLSIVFLSSCTTVKPYQKIYLNDSEMQFENSANRNYEKYVQSIREGAVPSSGTKTSGGCGCN
jgi:hypothetical protein